jgi:FHS family glucose/mannose:H+ symporter-like MFS transporter
VRRYRPTILLAFVGISRSTLAIGVAVYLLCAGISPARRLGLADFVLTRKIPQMSGPANSPLSSRLLAVLYFEFVLTGIVTTLLGPLIPVFVKRCAISDAAAGSLVGAQFAGQLVGALFANRNLRRSVVIGMPLISMGVWALAFSSCSLAYICTACYGVGLGLTISAINLIIARRQSHRRAYSLTLLNFLWGVGAVGSPILVESARQQQLLTASLFGVGLAGLVLWLALVRSDLSASPEQQIQSAAVSWYSPLLLFFGAMFFLYVGLETAVGAWTGLYATRMPRANDSNSAFAVGAFWLALLSGRLISAPILRRVPEQPVYRISLAFMLGGISLFLFSMSSEAVVVAAAVTGFGLAPLFPLVLSFASDSLLACRNSGWVFSSAGLGGAIVPWLTGRISTHFGSLRAGFVLPASAAVLMAVLSLTRFGRRVHSSKPSSTFPIDSPQTAVQ